MPESSEVAIITEGLQKRFGGQSLRSIEVVGGKFLKTGLTKPDACAFPLQNAAFYAKGKQLYWTFLQDFPVLAHLGMTGGFGAQNKHSALRLTFDDGETYFNDIRRFGNFSIIKGEELMPKLRTLGWDILRQAIPDDMVLRVRKYDHKTIAEVMLNQAVFAGLGNYLRSEICYDAKVNPFKTIEHLSDADIQRICMSTKKIVNLAYEAGGATIKDFKDFDGKSGKFFDQFQVYGKKMTTNGEPVMKTAAKDGRSVYYVAL